MAKAHLTCHPKDPRPFWVSTPDGKLRTFKTFRGAMRHALRTMDREPAREFDAAIAAAKAQNADPVRKVRKPRKPRKARKVRCAPVHSAEDTGLRRFKVSGKRGSVSVSRIVSARSRRAAADAFRESTGAVAFSVRMLRAAKSDGSAAKTKRGKAQLSAKRRSQRSAAETRVLRNVGLSEKMAEIALDAAAGPVRVAK